MLGGGGAYGLGTLAMTIACACRCRDARACATLRYGLKTQERCECPCHGWASDDFTLDERERALIEHIERSPAPRIPRIPARGQVVIPLRPSWWRRILNWFRKETP